MLHRSLAEGDACGWSLTLHSNVLRLIALIRAMMLAITQVRPAGIHKIYVVQAIRPAELLSVPEANCSSFAHCLSCYRHVNVVVT